jgi:uncharacterized RDD family membrane protein YckC
MESTKPFYITDDLLASTGQRFLHYIIDRLVVYALVFVFAAGIGIIANLIGAYEFLASMANIGPLGEYVAYFTMMITYFTISEGFTSRSVGKFITKTIVVNEDGSKPDVGTIFKRTLCRLIPFDALSYLGSNARGWHDTIPDVYVVKKEDFENKKELFYSFDEIGKSAEE